MNIQWKEGAVCFAGDYQRCFIDGEWLRLMLGEWASYSIGCTRKPPIEFKDYQLNTIKQGDYIEATELDTKEKYNQAIEVFGLFGYEFNSCAASEYFSMEVNDVLLCCDNSELYQNARNVNNVRLRKLTHQQLMAIGELKRLMNERENTSTLSDALNGNNSEKPNSCKEWPKVGDSALLVSLGMTMYNKPVKLTYVGDGVGCYVDLINGMEYTFAKREVVFKKIKTPGEELAEELAAKGVQDVVILANQIVNGEFDCIKYIPKEDR